MCWSLSSIRCLNHGTWVFCVTCWYDAVCSMCLLSDTVIAFLTYLLICLLTYQGLEPSWTITRTRSWSPYIRRWQEKRWGQVQRELVRGSNSDHRPGLGWRVRYCYDNFPHTEQIISEWWKKHLWLLTVIDSDPYTVIRIFRHLSVLLLALGGISDITDSSAV